MEEIHIVEAWIPAAIAGAVALAGAVGSWVQNRKNRKAAKSESELAYKREQENIEELKKYNAPSSQMQRFTEAGLNPNLMYSQGQPGQQAEIAKYGAAEQKYGNIVEPLGQAYGNMLQYQNIESSTNQNNASAASLEAQAGLTIAKEAGQLTNNQRASLELEVAEKYLMDTKEAQLNSITAGTSLKNAQTILTGLKTQWQTHQNKWMKVGIGPRDKMVFRVGIQLANKLGISLDSIFGTDTVNILKLITGK